MTTATLLGKRCQLPAWDGSWMRGDRYGAVTRINPKLNRAYVTTDKAHAVRWYPLDDIDRFVTWVG